MKRQARVIITSDEEGQSLLTLLSRRFNYHSSAEWQRLIANHRLLLNDQPAAADQPLHKGDTLQYLIPELPEPAVDQNFTVIFEDQHLLAIEKPATLPCHPGGCFFRHTLWYLVREQWQIKDVHIINRLDRETSGVVILAKNRNAARICREQFDQHLVTKEYLVAVHGNFPPRLEACGILKPDTNSPVRKKRCFAPAPDNLTPTGPDTAETTFCRVAQAPGISLLHALPKTGRLHQIRATLCSLGYPVIGDKIYGLDDRIFLRFIANEMTPDDQARLRLTRQALHAIALTLRHPATNQLLRLTAPLPAAIESLFPPQGNIAGTARS